MQKTRTRILAMLLAVMMCFSLLPVSAFAEEGDQLDDSTLQTTDVVTEEQPEDEEFVEEGENYEEPSEETVEEPEENQSAEEEQQNENQQDENQPSDEASVEEQDEETQDESDAEQAEEESELEELTSEGEELNAYSGTCGDNLTWTLSDDGTLTISGSGDMSNFVYYYDDGQAYSDDGQPWSGQRSSIKSVVIGAGITSIGRGAFYNCTELKKITFESESSLTTVGEYAFSDCGKLSAITLPGTVSEIGDGAFQDSGIVNITMPELVTKIPAYTFSHCGNLKTINLNNVTEIGNRAFYWS